MPKRIRDYDALSERSADKHCRWPDCGRVFAAQGLVPHERNCPHRLIDRDAPGPPEKRARTGSDALQPPVAVADVATVAASAEQPAQSMSSPRLEDIDIDPAPVEPIQMQDAPDEHEHGSLPLHYGPELPCEFIRIEYHPTSGRAPEIVSLDPEMPQSAAETSDLPRASQPGPAGSPWSPFSCKADFEFAEDMLAAQASRQNVNSILEHLHGSWSRGGSNVTFRSYDDMTRALDSAKAIVTDFLQGSVTVKYKGRHFVHHFYYRNPWLWIKAIVRDPLLSKSHIWHPVRKFYCRRDSEDDERIIDDANTGNRWWTVQTTLGEGHYLVPLHLWLDAGKVSNKVKMHPMVLRGLFQPDQIRNASGNGGGLLLGFMNQVKDPFNPHRDDNDSDTEFALYARDVYNSILGFIFADCTTPSRIGSLLRAGDRISRIIHPAILIASLDGLEAGHFCQCRGPTALHPYPTCEVHKDQLSKLKCDAPKRTISSMRAAYEEAAAASGSKREQLLTKHGIHFIKHFLWGFAHSDPYAAYGYDLLHSDDLGKFGHHLWPLLRNWLKAHNLAATVNLNAAAFPPSPGLERFPIDSKPLCKIDFSDGETFLSIEKIIPPCIVQVMPRNDPLVHCLSWHIAHRLMTGLKCSAASHREFHALVIEEYERWSSRVAVIYGKNFDFFKQHATAHAIESIEEMGAAHNQSTRPGEGFIQEVKQQYRRTNGRDVEKQMTKYDTWGEAVASIRTAIMEAEAEQTRNAAVDAEEPAHSVSAPTGLRVYLGSPSRKWEDVSVVEQRLSEQDPIYCGLGLRLRAALKTSFRTNSEEFHGSVKIHVHNCVYVHYASVEDFREARDILRCAPKWFGQPRFDCALFDDNMGSVHTHKAVRLRALLKCKLMSTGEIHDVVAVTQFAPHSWRPRTVYRGCRVIKEAATLDFVHPEQLIRGAIVCPAFGAPRSIPRLHYLQDSTGDGDLFLRLNNLAITMT